ncbi:MAG TPA: hypothetical protein VEJ41_00555 [Candidatus Acidoferrales bacterium]|nr:hypothetical protein [Candidatus Acidoferrales bacterium]
MKNFRSRIATALWSLVVASTVCAKVALADGSSGPVYYPNGDVATAIAECAPGLVCGTVTQPSGDQIKVLIGDSGHCNAYVVTFMRVTNNQVVAVWTNSTDRNPDSQSYMGSRCGGFRNTHMMVDGTIDMGVFQNTDGQVFVLFFGGSMTPPPTQSATPGPPPAPSATPSAAPH